MLSDDSVRSTGKKRTLFIHDSSQVQKEEDDPLKAIVHFTAPQPWSNDNKCWLCGSLVTLHDSVKKVTDSALSKVTLRTLVFAVQRVDSCITLGLGCSVDNVLAKDIVNELNALLEIVRFRYATVSGLLSQCKDVEKLDLIKLLLSAENLQTMNAGFETQIASSLFLENVSKRFKTFGACLLFQGQVVQSSLDWSFTKTVVAAKAFLRRERTKIEDCTSGFAHSPAFLPSDQLHLLRKQCKQKPDSNACESNRVEVRFSVFCLRQMEFLILQEADSFVAEKMYSLDGELSHLEEQISHAMGTWIEPDEIA